jgi:hypothetical protein
MIKIIVIASALGLFAPVISMLLENYFRNAILQIILVGGISILLIYAVLFFFERNGLVKDLKNLAIRKNLL